MDDFTFWSLRSRAKLEIPPLRVQFIGERCKEPRLIFHLRATISLVSLLLTIETFDILGRKNPLFKIREFVMFFLLCRVLAKILWWRQIWFPSGLKGVILFLLVTASFTVTLNGFDTLVSSTVCTIASIEHSPTSLQSAGVKIYSNILKSLYTLFSRQCSWITYLMCISAMTRDIPSSLMPLSLNHLSTALGSAPRKLQI